MRIDLIQNLADFLRGKISLQYLKHTFLKNKSANSQLGEDIALADLIGNKDNGFYIDIGANHPTKINNTKLFYDRGWTGINVEANPNLIEAFRDERTNDINLNIGITQSDGEMLFYVLSDDTLSSFCKNDVVNTCKTTPSVEVAKEIVVKTMSLQTLFDNYVKEKKIDFMSVDAEGYDLVILESNDWSKYRPNFIVLEMRHDMKNLRKFMRSVGYKVVYKNPLNYIYKDSRYCGNDKIK